MTRKEIVVLSFHPPPVRTVTILIENVGTCCRWLIESELFLHKRRGLLYVFQMIG